MKQIPLSQGKFATVDDDMFDYLNQWKWYARKSDTTFYAQRSIRLDNNRRALILMHRVVLCLTDSTKEGDHLNGDGLLNTRINLRAATHAQNQMNQGVHVNNTSGFKGVSWQKKTKKWTSQINIGGKKMHLGQFISKIEAAEKYNEAAIKYHGEFAKLNQLKTISWK